MDQHKTLRPPLFVQNDLQRLRLLCVTPWKLSELQSKVFTTKMARTLITNVLMAGSREEDTRRRRFFVGTSFCVLAGILRQNPKTLSVEEEESGNLIDLVNKVNFHGLSFPPNPDQDSPPSEGKRKRHIATEEIPPRKRKKMAHAADKIFKEISDVSEKYGESLAAVLGTQILKSNGEAKEVLNEIADAVVQAKGA